MMCNAQMCMLKTNKITNRLKMVGDILISKTFKLFSRFAEAFLSSINGGNFYITIKLQFLTRALT